MYKRLEIEYITPSAVNEGKKFIKKFILIQCKEKRRREKQGD